MEFASKIFKRTGNKKGAVLVFVAIAIVVIVIFTAFAIDLGYLFVVGNELKNAADAGALAGAQVLYLNDGTQVNANANQVAFDIARANTSQRVPVDVHWTAGQNSGGNVDVQRGHWSFASSTFTANDSLEPVDLWNATTAELDANLNFINAVRVWARREDTPALSFFSRIFGYNQYFLRREAVAYIGFAGTLGPGEADQPIAICKQAIRDSGGEYTCGVGRMINSGANIGHETGGWTNFTQGPCSTASASSVRPLICSSGNPGPLYLGEGMGTVGGMQQTGYDRLIECWQTQAGLPARPNSNNPADFPTAPWQLKLPVVDCPGNNMGNCSELVGAVVLNVIWITRTGFKNSLAPIPTRMAGIPNDDPNIHIPDWVSPGLTPQENWQDFVRHFKLKDVLNNSDATAEDKTIYFLPDCTPHPLAGNTGGENFGVLARIPVLVK